MKHHDPQVRAAAMAALLSGQGVGAVSRAYEVPASTVSRWRKQARKEAGHSDDIGELLLSYLVENLRTLRSQVEFFRSEGWLAEQSAADLAVLHGVTADKAVRLLEALEGGPLDG